MLINFHCRASGDFSMFEEVASTLLRKMGHSGTVPGAILAEDIPLALQRLQSGLEAEDVSENQQDDEEEPVVSLSRRAYPLIKMLEAARNEGCEVMWDR